MSAISIRENKRYEFACDYIVNVALSGALARLAVCLANSPRNQLLLILTPWGYAVRLLLKLTAFWFINFA